MAAKKTAGKANPAATKSVAAGAPTGRWAEVLTETRAKGRAIEPFEITADLVLSPPTPKRVQAMSRATLAVQAAITASVNAVKFGASQQEVSEIRDAIEAGDDAYTRALVGDDKYEAVQEYFAERGEWEREAFYEALKEQFLRLPSEEEQSRIEVLESQVTKLIEALATSDPDNQVIAEILGETPGKGNDSSTTSVTTGTSSKETSPDTSESGPETGASTDLGASSSTTPKLSLA